MGKVRVNQVYSFQMNKSERLVAQRLKGPAIPLIRLAVYVKNEYGDWVPNGKKLTMSTRKLGELQTTFRRLWQAHVNDE